MSCNETVKFDQTIYIPLDWQLNEVSGLTTDGKNLFAVNDEKGVIYSLNPDDFGIKKRIKFKKNGDYEGITFALGDFYILKSNGVILQISKNGEIINQFKSPKKFKGFEFEGIAYEKSSNQLLIACKKHPSKKQNKFISIYSFKLSSGEFNLEPSIKVEKNDKLKNFTPSGLEWNNNLLYIISSKTAELLTFDTKLKKNQSLKSFNSDALPQIEGLTLLDNKFYIASEKNKNLNASIYSFPLE